MFLGKSPELSYSLTPLNTKAKELKDDIRETSIVGGNLFILLSHVGTPTALKGKDKIVLIEEEPQRPERVETMMMGLIRANTFQGAKGVIFGSFLDPQLDQERFKSVKPILLCRLVDLLESNGVNVPIFQVDNFGHGDINDPLPFGTEARIQIQDIPILKIHTR